MDQTLNKSANRSAWLPIAATMALGLSLLAGQGFGMPGSAVDFLAANSERHFANSSPSAPAVASPEKQTRTQSKAPRRQIQSGVLPPHRAPDMPDVCGERVSRRSAMPGFSYALAPQRSGTPILVLVAGLIIS